MQVIDFSIDKIDINVETTKLDNTNVQSGCWGDTGSGAYC